MAGLVETDRYNLNDLIVARSFFSELQSAAKYDLDFTTGNYHSTRLIDSAKSGKVEFVRTTETIDLQRTNKHLASLEFVARKLDKIPIEFWNDYGHRQDEGLPYVPMQIWLWGSGEKPDEKTQMMIWGNFDKERGPFSKQSKIYNDIISYSMSKRTVDTDNAEQCFRIMDAYIQLRWHFGSVGLPEGVKNF